MSRRTCVSCDNPVKDQITICSRCERQTSQHLGDMEAHRAELEVTLTRQATFNASLKNDAIPLRPDPNVWDQRDSRPLRARYGASQSSAAPVPYDGTASDLLGAQRAILASWCKLVHDEIDEAWPRDTVSAMSMFIEAHLRDLRKHEAAGELVEEIRDLVGRIMRCIDYPEDRAKIHVGPCPEQTEDEQCPGQLYLHLPYRNDGKRPRVKCSACGTVWFAEQFHRLGYRIPMDANGAQRLARVIGA